MRCENDEIQISASTNQVIVATGHAHCWPAVVAALALTATASSCDGARVAAELKTFPFWSFAEICLPCSSSGLSASTPSLQAREGGPEDERPTALSSLPAQGNALDRSAVARSSQVFTAFAHLLLTTTQEAGPVTSPI